MSRRILAAVVLSLLLGAPAHAGDPAPPSWLDREKPIQVGADGAARSIYQPEFRPAPWLKQQLGHHALKGLVAELVTPVVAVARPPGAKADPAPVAGRILLRGTLALVMQARAILREHDLAPRAVFVSLLVSEVVRHKRNARGGSLLFDKAGVASPDAALFRSFSTSFEPDDFIRSSLTGSTPFEGTSVAFGNSNVLGSAFEYTLRLLQKEGEAEFLAWPNLLVNEGQAASMTATRVVPQFLLQDDGNESFTTVPEETGLKLRVTPVRIGREEAVLDLDVWLRLPEEVSGSSTVPGTLRLKLRQVTTRITVRDREPLLIGGLVLRRTERDRRGLPRPRALRALDPLHSSQVRDQAETEIVFLVRPRLVPPGRRPAELDPATYRAWTSGEKLRDPWSEVKDPRAKPPRAK